MVKNGAPVSRRNALKASLGLAVASLDPGTIPRALGFESANARPRIAVVGCGIRWDKRVFVADGRYGVGKQFPRFGDIVSVCDVDANRLARAKDVVKGWLGKVPEGTGDYRHIIDDPKIDVVSKRRKSPPWEPKLRHLDPSDAENGIKIKWLFMLF